MRRLLLFMMCAVAVFLSSCAVAMEEIPWDSRFTDYFRPTECVLELTQGAVQNIDKEYVCGDYTLRIAQILGDAKTIYIAADIIFPAGADLEILPKTKLVDDVVSFEEIKNLSAQELENQYLHIGYSGSGGVQQVSTNYEENSVSYLFYFSRDSGRFSADGLSLLVYDENVNAVASWTPKRNNSQILSWQLLDNNGKDIGAVELSCFALNVKMYLTGYKSLDEFNPNVTVTAKDGASFPLRVSVGGSSSSAGIGVSINYLFRNLLPLEDIAYVQVGDYKLEVNL